MSRYYYQARKSKKGSAKSSIAGILLILSAAVLISSVVAPELTGKFGEKLHEILSRFAGHAAILIPLYMGWLGFQLFSKDKNNRKLLNFFLFFSILISSASLFSIFHTARERAPGGMGGGLGDYVSLFLIQQFGWFLTALFLTLGGFCAASFLVGISPVSVLLLLKDKIAQDIADWQAEKKKFQDQSALRKKLDKAVPSNPALPETKKPNIIFSPVNPAMKSVEKTKEKPAPIQLSQKNGEVEKQKPTESKAAAKSSKTDVPPSSLPANAANGNSYDHYHLPEAELLTVPEQAVHNVSKEELYANGTLLEQTLDQFGVKAKVIDIHPGPVITRYDLSPAPGVRVQQIETLSNDIALAMKAQSLRVLAPIPGKGAVGIEISNPNPAIVYFKEILLSPHFQKAGTMIPLGLGKATEGNAFVADLVGMPHLLIAGATGSGKSVCIHSLILSILFRFKPDEVKMLLIDPKRLELPLYDELPHLYNPAVNADRVRVVIEPKEVVHTLKKLIEVMDERYRTFARYGVRNIEGCNEKMKAQGLPKVPYIVVIIDELADLMIVVGKEIEDSIQRLAQMARAVGIHLVLATQRPSVDVITGVIKANLPSRIAFQVLSKTDSRVILDAQGAEDLLGRGDMLFLATGAPKPVRLQGAFVSEGDVSKVVQFIKEQNFKPQYEMLQSASNKESILDNEENRKLLIRAAEVTRDMKGVSGDLLRDDEEIGSKYRRALALLEQKGLIEKPEGTNRWKVHFDLLNDFLAEVEKES